MTKPNKPIRVSEDVKKTLKKIKADKAEETGRYYRMMMEHVNKTLKDVKRVCPVYDEKQGYELAGFVWFQGFNDLVDGRFGDMPVAILNILHDLDGLLGVGVPAVDDAVDRFGFAGAGVGLEYMMGRRWSLQAEGDFTYFGDSGDIKVIAQAGIYYYW